MLEKETKTKYISLLKRGYTLKSTREDILEVLESNSELSVIASQNNKLPKDDVLFFIPTGKMICKVLEYNNKKYLYWCPCEFKDILSCMGVMDVSIDVDNNAIYTFVNRPKEDQVSFLGKDIKKAVRDLENYNNIEKKFFDTYVNTDHALGENIYYSIIIKEVNGVQEIKCFRNLNLSPRNNNAEYKESKK